MAIVNFEEISKSWGLDFWAKAIGIFIPISIFIGYAFLNGYYAVWWGFTDYSISKAVCVVVMIWFVLIAYLADRFGRIFNAVVERVEKSRHKRWIVSLFAFLSILPIALSYLPYTRQFAKNHQIYLSPGRVLAIYLCIVYVALIFILSAPISWLREFIKGRASFEGMPASQETASGMGRRLSQIGIGVFAILIVFWAFAGTYSLIPTRYGGGGADPIQFWVPRSAEDIFSGFSCHIIPDKPNNEPSATGTSDAEYLHYSHFYLVHEGADNLTLVSDSDTCDQILQVPKDFVKGRQWRNPSFVAHHSQQTGAGSTKANR